MNNAQSQELTFSGSMDVDSDPRDLKPGDYFHALNLRNIFTENGKEGSAENISSNTLVSNALPGGINKCIGSYEDVPGQTVFYFIWNSNGDHRIYRYYPNNTTDIVQTIVAGSVLEFGEWDYISHINLVENILYWTDGVRPQRQIDVVRANDIGKRRSFLICFGVKLLPSSTVRYTFSNGLTPIGLDVVFNTFVNTRAEAAQTAYTAFIGNPVLAASFTIVNKGEYIEFTSNITGPLGLWVVTITTLSGSQVSWCKPVNYYYQINERVLDVVGWPGWLEPDTYLDSDQSARGNYLNGNTFQFAYSINYDDGRQSVISKYSRLMFNENININNYSKDYTDYSQTNIQVGSADLNVIVLTYSDSGRLESGRDIISSINIYVRNNNEENLRLIYTIPSYQLDGVYKFTNANQGIQISDDLQGRLYDNIPITSKCQEVVNNKLFYANNKFGYNNTNVIANIVSDIYPIESWDTTRKLDPLPYGKYQFGIVYFDRFGRNTFVQTNSTMVVSMQSASLSPGTKVYVTWSIPNSLQPPIEATHYAWVRTRELTTIDYWPIATVSSAGPPAVPEVQYKDASGNNVSWPNANIRTADLNVKFLIPTLTYKKFVQGDQLLLRDDIGVFSVAVIAFDAATNILSVDYNVAVNPRLQQLNVDVPISRIFTPYRQNANELFYEVFECYNVLNPGTPSRAHQGGWEGTDQVPGSVNASGYFYFGWDTFMHLVNPAVNGITYAPSPYAISSRTSSEEVVVTTRLPIAGSRGNPPATSNNNPRPRTSAGSNLPMSPDNGSSNDETIEQKVEVLLNQYKVSGIGRPNTVIPENKQVIIGENICFSNPRNPYTNYNGFGTFGLRSNNNISSGFGSIQRLKNIDNILLSVCDNKAFSVYVDKGILQGQDGSQTISVSSEVIGTYRELNGLHGTINPESFATNDGLVFWWDAYRGEVCQYSSQGIDVISSKRSPDGSVIIGMNNYFSPKGRLGIQSNRTQYKVLGGIHKQFKEYILAFPEITIRETTYPAETISYNYIANGWKTKYSYLPENICGIGINIATFKNGLLYIHSPNSIKNTFYGVLYNTEVGNVINISPNVSKTFLSLSMESNKSPNYPVITTPLTDWNIAGQESELLETDFEFMNGSYWASFFKNKLTPNSPSQSLALINGEELQAQIMTLNYSKSGNSLLWINKATVYLIKDDLTN